MTTTYRAPGRGARVLARIRGPLVAIAVPFLVAATLWRVVPSSGIVEERVRALASLLGLLLIVAALLLARFGLGRPGAVAPIVAPSAGEWTALSSPATRIPSHGTHQYAQTWAIDLIHTPADRPRPSFGGARASMAPEEFPSFGMPVHAGADGEVVVVRDRAADRRSRNSWSLLPLFFVESFVRGILGWRFVFGNVIVIALDGGGYQAIAHLRKGSVRVAVGDRVSAGELIAECGNSGNSTEPHLHVQLMHRPRPGIAVGLPLAFVDSPVPERDQSVHWPVRPGADN
ncbi:M23 family metallopeptidase [Microbacterium sp. RU33B]|uniref:M23 family metallopeptidase n=1 Tax=Microbacterium sp. RU33B TaxID=1907390 RepID=UPI000975A27E|nr:M23 family metallopeptidase [Microbacterium sp. RU33B]